MAQPGPSWTKASSQTSVQARLVLRACGGEKGRERLLRQMETKNQGRWELRLQMRSESNPGILRAHSWEKPPACILRLGRGWPPAHCQAQGPVTTLTSQAQVPSKDHALQSTELI